MKTRHIVLAMLVLAAFVPSVSAHHGMHECTEADPCDDIGNNGCEDVASVGCVYSGHTNCYHGMNAQGQQAMYCYHYTNNCIVNVYHVCEVHGSLPLVKAVSPQV